MSKDDDKPEMGKILFFPGQTAGKFNDEVLSAEVTQVLPLGEDDLQIGVAFGDIVDGEYVVSKRMGGFLKPGMHITFTVNAGHEDFVIVDEEGVASSAFISLTRINSFRFD